MDPKDTLNRITKSEIKMLGHADTCGSVGHIALGIPTAHGIATCRFFQYLHGDKRDMCTSLQSHCRLQLGGASFGRGPEHLVSHQVLEPRHIGLDKRKHPTRHTMSQLEEVEKFTSTSPIPITSTIKQKRVFVQAVRMQAKTQLSRGPPH